MALKTGRRALVLLAPLVLAAALPSGAQDSPLQWPVPPPGPPRQAAPPRLLIAASGVAAELAAGAVPLDARGPGAAFAAGHLPGAVPAWSAGADDVDLARVRSRLAGAGISGEETVVLYGGGFGDTGSGDGGREALARLFWLLRWAGVRDIRLLDGGLAAWRAAAGAVETGAPRRAAAAAFHPAAATETATDAGWIAGTLVQAGVQLLDVRDARGWERWATPPTFAAGHIPYSLPFDPAALLPPKEGWPDPTEVRRHATRGPRPGDPVRPDSVFVLYGTDAADPRPRLGYLLLSLAGLDARIYPGGWREWWSGGERPVVRVITAPELAGRLRRDEPGLAGDRPPAGLILLDLREPRDFAIGHLPGARSLPFLHFSRDFETVVRTGWPGADRATFPLVLYCYGIDCVRSRKAGALAARLGFRDVIWFRGGIREWRDAGYPLPETPVSSSPPPKSPPSPPPGRGSPARAGGRPSP
jgi:thiosulfate/3-mercaptopyruvate sulfurtransferase